MWELLPSLWRAQRLVASLPADAPANSAAGRLVPFGHSVVNWDYTRKREGAFHSQNWD
jgi:hypothetical protein